MLRIALMIAGILPFVLARASWGQSAGTPYVAGTVTYLQRSALPPDAIVVVRLQDVSFQGVQPANIVAEQKIAAGGKQPPIPFQIAYADADIDPAHSYAVLAMISAGDRMLFASTASYPVITSGAPKQVEIRVQPVSVNGASAKERGTTSARARANASAELLGTEWKLAELAGQPVTDVPDGKNAHLILHDDGESLSGSSGCNRLVGTYKVNGHALYFEPVGLTRMACPEALMKQEQAFLEALNGTTRYAVSGETLELRKDDEVLARFRSSRSGGSSGELSSASVAAKLPENWLGQWNGPEGTYLILSKTGDDYQIEIRSLEGVQTYQGAGIADRIQFAREGTSETIHAGTGEQTGMKWLAGKRNCLIIKSGEGFCRD